MKILHVGKLTIKKPGENIQDSPELISGFGNDGPTRNILNLSKALAELGHEVGVFSTRPFPADLKLQMPLITFLYEKPLSRQFPWYHSKNITEKIASAFGEPDIINFHSVYNPDQVALSHHFMKRKWKYIVTPRGGLCEFAQNRAKLKKTIANALFFNAFLKRAERVVALCNDEAADIRWYNSALKTFVSPNGVTDELLQYKHKGIPEKRDGIIVGFLGQIDFLKKGLDFLLNAIAQYQKTGTNANIRFSFVGAPCTEKDKVLFEKHLDKLPRRDLINVLGPMYNNDKFDFLSEVDIFIHTSRMEGMPTAVLEAMALGKPCILTKGTNVTDIVSKSGGGWTCGNDWREIADILKQVAELSRNELAVIGRRNRTYLEKNLTWKKVASDYVEQIKMV